MIRPQLILDLNEELIVDNFAGGGGASTGIELALGRHVDIAVNHDPEAVAMHAINHPQTHHECEDVFKVDALQVTKGRPVGFAWFSPDCKHFSKAKGGKPRSKKIRGLAWIMVKWAALVRPRVMVLENVEEFKTWGPLLDDGSPCPKRKGKTFRSFVAQLRRLGYQVEDRELRACDYGAPTIRKRLFLIARCDGKPIVWPEPTHGRPDSPAVKSGKLQPWRTAAECIDWSIPCPSIFERQKPLADATMRRIARGIQKFVINAANPFIVKVNHAGCEHFRGQSLDEPLQTITAKHGWGLATPFITEHANASAQRIISVDEPLRTQCGEVKGGHFAVVAPHLVGAGGPTYGGKPKPLDEPGNTQTTENHTALVAAHLTRYNSEKRENDAPRGQEPDAPVSTLDTQNRFGVVEAKLESIWDHARFFCGDCSTNFGVNDYESNTVTCPKCGNDSSKTIKDYLQDGGAIDIEAGTLIQTGYGERDGQQPRVPGLDKPLGTVVAGGQKHAAVTAFLAKHQTERHPGEVQGASVEEPAPTVKAKDSNALVTAHLVGCGGRAGQSRPRGVDEPTATSTAKADTCVVAASLIRHFGESTGQPVDAPAPTVMGDGLGKTGLIASHISKLKGTCKDGQPTDEPLHTVQAGGNHYAEVRAFLIRYYSNEAGIADITKPSPTVTATDRIGLVTVGGEEFFISDIGMRMLEPHELYAAQGFPKSYIIAPFFNGRQLPKHAQVRMCGNSVCPPLAKAITAANVPEMSIVRQKAA